MIFLKIALLNLKKHGKRTMLILFAIVLSVVVMIFVGGLLEGMRQSFFRSMYQDSGHLQLHAEGYSDSLNRFSLEHLIDRPDEIISRLESDSRLRSAGKILSFGALLIHEQKNIAVMGTGFDPSTAFFSRIRESMDQGGLPEGESGIAIGTEAARLLDLSSGDQVILLVEDSQGSPFYYQYEISGIFDTGSEDYDAQNIFITHQAAEELLYLEDATTEIRITLEDPEQAEAFKNDKQELFDRFSLEAETWRDIHGSFIVAFELFDVFMFFIDLLIVVVTATVITNAILMNVFERTQEFGTLRAVGLKKRQQFVMIMTEGGIQGSIGSFLGAVLGILLTWYFTGRGIEIGAVGESFGVSRTIRPALSVLNVALGFSAGILTALAASLYAGAVSSRKSITSMFRGMQ